MNKTYFLLLLVFCMHNTYGATAPKQLREINFYCVSQQLAPEYEYYDPFSAPTRQFISVGNTRSIISIWHHYLAPDMVKEFDHAHAQYIKQEMKSYGTTYH